MLKTTLTAAAAILLTAAPAAAEMELSLYMGVQAVTDSNASGALPDGTPFDQTIDWKGKSLDSPFYYGGRATWWTANNLGFGIEGTHTKAYASASDRNDLNVDRLEFTDGHNIVTANVLKRFPDAYAGSGFTPYLGGGIGLAIPHVDIQVEGTNARTHDYETTGLALRGIAGMKYALSDRWALFGEYQIVWSDNDVTIDADPAVPGQTDGTLKTELLTHAVNIGVSYSF